MAKKKTEVVKEKPHLKGCTCLVCKPVKQAQEKVAKSSKVVKGKAKELPESANEGINDSEPAKKANLGQLDGKNSSYKQLDDRIRTIETIIRGNPVEAGIATGFAVLLVIGMIVLIIWWLPQAGEIPYTHLKFK